MSPETVESIAAHLHAKITEMVAWGDNSFHLRYAVDKALTAGGIPDLEGYNSQSYDRLRLAACINGFLMAKLPDTEVYPTHSSGVTSRKDEINKGSFNFSQAQLAAWIDDIAYSFDCEDF